MICVFSLYTAVSFTRSLSILLIFSKTHLFCFIDFSVLFSTIQLVFSASIFIMSFFPNVCVCVLNRSEILTLCDHMEYSPPGSYFHGIFQARILGRLPFPPPGNLPDPGIKPRYTASFALAIGFFTTETPGKLSFQLRWIYFGLNF